MLLGAERHANPTPGPLRTTCTMTPKMPIAVSRAASAASVDRRHAATRPPHRVADLRVECLSAAPE
jgi:hypothetical protein